MSEWFAKYFGNSPAAIIASFLIVTICAYAIYNFLVRPFLDYYFRIKNNFGQGQTNYVFIEITPPARTDKSQHASNQLFAILQKLIDRRSLMSLEIVSSGKDGIRFLIRVREDLADVLQRHIAAYIPESNIRKLDKEYLPEDACAAPYWRILEFGQFRHYAYPLQKQNGFTEHDPVDFIAGSFARLDLNEAIVMQLIISPHYSILTNRLYNRMIRNGDVVLDNKIRHFLISRWWVWIVAGAYGYFTKQYLTGLYAALLGIVISFFWPKSHANPRPAEQKIIDTMLEKLAEPMFKVDFRVLVNANTNKRINQLTKGVRSSLAPLSASGFQALHVKRKYPDRLGQKFALYKLGNRLPSFFPFDSNILAASELTEIYHLPHGEIQIEDLVKSHSKTLPVPIAIKNGDFDVVLGINSHHGTANKIGLTEAERERHMYIIGGTGNGKTTMLQYAIVQDIQNGKGVAVIDPHGDLAKTLLRHIPENRIKDVIYFNPRDLSYPIGLNLLELPQGLNEDELLVEKDFITESIISLFRKTFSEDDSGGHRIEYVLRNAIHTAMTVEDATLFTILKLLRNASFRKKVASKLKDSDLKDFWKEELGDAGNFQRVKMSAGITAKVDRYKRSASVKRIMGQTKSTINFENILDGKILICSLDKGKIGEDTSELFGISILTQLQLAAYRRIRQDYSERRPFYVYVDEFQNFATTQFLQMLSEARKYKLFLTMAEQSTAQQEEQMVGVILNNAGTVVCFRADSERDLRYMLPRFSPYVSERDIGNLPSYKFYMKISAVNPQEPFSGETLLLDNPGSVKIANKVIDSSRKNYAAEYQHDEAPKTVARPQVINNRKEPKKEEPQIIESSLDEPVIS